MKRNKKGISLIVLVITIIIMIILAAAIIITLSDSNIIDRADTAVSKTNLSQIQEMASVAWTEAYGDGKKTQPELETAVINSLKANGIKENELNNYIITVTTEGVTVEVVGPALTIDQTLGESEVGCTKLDSASFTLSGTVTDNKGVKSLKVNGVEVVIGDEGKWSTNLTLEKNEILELTVVATNNINNSTTKKGYVAYIEYVDIAVTASNLSTLNCAIDENGVLNIPATYYNASENVWYRATSIGDSAFQDNTSLTSVIIPDGVVSIGKWAFVRCTGLTSITLPDSITSMGAEAFEDCTNLESITIPAGVTYISSSMFERCTSLTSITIPAGVTCVSSWTFNDCTRLTSVIFENTEGWYVTTTVGATSGTDMDVTNTATNAANLKSAYRTYNWYRK